MGASLLVFKNKSDVAGSMTEDEIREVCLSLSPRTARRADHHHTNHRHTGIALRQHSHAQVADHDVQRHDRREPPRRSAMGRPGRQRPPFPLLIQPFCPRCYEHLRHGGQARVTTLQLHPQDGLALACTARVGFSGRLASHSRDVNKCTMVWRAWVVCRSTAARRHQRQACPLNYLAALETELKVTCRPRSRGRCRRAASMRPHSNDLGLC
jgi:hypothetical protein